MTTYVDTSALYALFDQTDQNHAAAGRQLDALLARGEDLVCTNYILLETIALLQRRIGVKPVKDLQDVASLALSVIWVDESLHQAGVGALLVSNRRQFSLVDCVSFIAMRRFGIATAFAFDRHFTEQGFDCIPTP